MMEITIYTANCTGNRTNCVYPNEVVVHNPEELARAVKHDHVVAKYKNNYRSNDNFAWALAEVWDNDNAFSDNPSDWIIPQQLAEGPLKDVSFIAIPSRHNMKPKGNYSARPRYHIICPIQRCTSAAVYAAIKAEGKRKFPFFDEKALDAARFLYGSDVKPEEIFWHEGTMTIDGLLPTLPDAVEVISSEANEATEAKAVEAETDEDDPFSHVGPVIPEGSRNATMSHFAGKVLKRFGESDEAHVAFLEMAGNCDPPLEDGELASIWNSALKFYRKKVSADPTYVSPQEYNNPNPGWPEPLQFSKFTLLKFPVDALPAPIGDYVRAVAESTQTSEDMAGTIALSILSTCLQKKYLVQGKADWKEPLNTYAIVVAPPSERKSSVLHLMLQPLNDYEVEYNKQNAASVEAGKMQKRILERRQKAIEEKIAKGKAEPGELEQIAKEIAECTVPVPKQLYSDDVTTEKLVSIIATNGGYASLISSEGGIFDTLAGIYTKNVNIDVMLKGYSGDTIRVDRIGRESESIMDPALTILLMAQPNVVSDVLGNATFRGRGLTARFLYSMPESFVGERKYRSTAVTPEIYHNYESRIVNLLEDEYPEKQSIITLSPEADQMLEDFANWLEPKLKNELSEIADWAGKLVGNVLRIAGLLCRADRYVDHDFLTKADPFVVSGEIMQHAISLGKYYLNHAQAAYSVLPEDAMYHKADLVLQRIREHKVRDFNRRDAMRLCRTFKTVESIQPVLDFLEDYGYLMQKPQKPSGTGRPPLPKYAVNPWVFEKH